MVLRLAPCCEFAKFSALQCYRTVATGTVPGYEKLSLNTVNLYGKYQYPNTHKQQREMVDLRSGHEPTTRDHFSVTCLRVSLRFVSSSPFVLLVSLLVRHITSPRENIWVSSTKHTGHGESAPREHLNLGVSFVLGEVRHVSAPSHKRQDTVVTGACLQGE